MFIKVEHTNGTEIVVNEDCVVEIILGQNRIILTDGSDYPITEKSMQSMFNLIGARL